MDVEARIDRFIRNASRLPAFPAVLSRLFKVIDAPDSSADDVAKIVERDSALTARLLKVANSSFYGRPGGIASVRQAVVVLGHKTVRSVTLAVWTHTLRPKNAPPSDLSLQITLFYHGVMTAVTSKVLVSRIDRSLEEDAFLAGLLHDIGRVAVASQLGCRYREGVIDRCAATKESLVDVEREVLGFDHGQLGATLMRSWHIPDFLPGAAEHHHDEYVDARMQPVMAAVALGDGLASELEPNVAPESPRPRKEQLRNDFRVSDPDSLEQALTDSRRDFEAFVTVMA